MIHSLGLKYQNEDYFILNSVVGKYISKMSTLAPPKNILTLDVWLLTRKMTRYLSDKLGLAP